MCLVGRIFLVSLGVCLGRKARPGGENPLLDGLDTCCRHRTECGGMQILQVFGLSDGLVCIVAFRNFLCSVGVCVGDG